MLGSELIVAGFHRSGTSMTMQALHAAGLFVGDELIDASPSNPYGHYEDAEVMRIHKAILAANQRTWKVDRPLIPAIPDTSWRQVEDLIDRRRAQHSFWGFKDPRVCLFLGMWRHLMPASKVLVVYRDFHDCAASLHRRHGRQMVDGFGSAELHRPFFEEPDLAVRMWVVHNAALLREVRHAPQSTKVISFGALAAGYPIFARLRDLWDLPLGGGDHISTFDDAVTTERSWVPILDEDLERRAESILEELAEVEMT